MPLTPTVSAISGPPSGTLSTVANFTWTLGGGAATVTCRLDGAVVQCPSSTSANVYTASRPAASGYQPHVRGDRVERQPGDGDGARSQGLAYLDSEPAAAGGHDHRRSGESESDDGHERNVQLDGRRVRESRDVHARRGFRSHARERARHVTGLTTDANGVTHTFAVTASNVTGPATASRTLDREPAAADGHDHDGADERATTATSANFAWTLGGGPTGSVTCTLDGGAVACTDRERRLDQPLHRRKRRHPHLHGDRHERHRAGNRLARLDREPAAADRHERRGDSGDGATSGPFSRELRRWRPDDLGDLHARQRSAVAVHGSPFGDPGRRRRTPSSSRRRTPPATGTGSVTWTYGRR